MLQLTRKPNPSDIIPEELSSVVLSCNDNNLVPTCFSSLVEFSLRKDSPITWSNDGSLFAFVNSGNSVVVYKKQETGKFYLFGQFSGPTSKILNIILYKDNQHLISCGKDGLYVWDILTKNCIYQLLSNQNMLIKDGICSLLSIDNINRVIAGTFDGKILLLSIPDYTILDSTTAQRDSLLSMVYSNKLQLLVTIGTDTSMNLWSINHNKLQFIISLDISIGRNKVITLSSDETRLYGRFDNQSIQIWDLEKYSKIGIIDYTQNQQQSYGNLIYMYSLSDTELLCCYSTGMIHILLQQTSATTSESSVSESFADLDSLLAGDMNDDLIIPVETHNQCSLTKDHILHYSFNPFSNLLLLSSSHSLSLYQKQYDSSWKFIQQFCFHEEAITSLLLLDNTLISTAKDNLLIQYDLQVNASQHFLLSSTVIQSIQQHNHIIYTGCTDYQIHCYTLQPYLTPCQNDPFTPCASQIHCLAIHPFTGILLTGSDNGILSFYSIPSEDYQHHHISSFLQISDHIGKILSLGIQDTDEASFYCATGGIDYTLNVYSFKHNQVKKQWSQKNAHYGAITCLVFGKGEKNNLIYTGGYDSNIHIWDCSSGEMIGSLDSHKERINALAISEDGHYLVSAGADKMVIVWDVENNYSVKCKFCCVEECTCVVLNDNFVICGYSSGVIRKWPLYTESTKELFQDEVLCKHDNSQVESFRLE